VPERRGFQEKTKKKTGKNESWEIKKRRMFFYFGELTNKFLYTPLFSKKRV